MSPPSTSVPTGATSMPSRCAMSTASTRISSDDQDRALWRACNAWRRFSTLIGSPARCPIIARELCSEARAQENDENSSTKTTTQTTAREREGLSCPLAPLAIGRRFAFRDPARHKFWFNIHSHRYYRRGAAERHAAFSFRTAVVPNRCDCVAGTHARSMRRCTRRGRAGCCRGPLPGHAAQSPGRSILDRYLVGGGSWGLYRLCAATRYYFRLILPSDSPVRIRRGDADRPARVRHRACRQLYPGRHIAAGGRRDKRGAGRISNADSRTQPACGVWHSSLIQLALRGHRRI